jgi:molybdopterin synthase sulfur carrier subunit
LQVHVLFFASYGDIAGAPAIDLNLTEGATVSECIAALGRQYPRFAQVLPRGRVAVNLEIVDDNHALKSGDEVAFMPPMSGG